METVFTIMIKSTVKYVSKKLSRFIFLTSMYLETGIGSDEFQRTCSREDTTKTSLNGDLV